METCFLFQLIEDLRNNMKDSNILLDIITFEEDLSLDELHANSLKESFTSQTEGRE